MRKLLNVEALSSKFYCYYCSFKILLEKIVTKYVNATGKELRLFSRYQENNEREKPFQMLFMSRI